MTGFDKILTCVDGSKPAEEAVRRSIEIAKNFRSSITLLFVWEPPNTSGRGFAPGKIPANELEKIEGAKKMLESAGIKFETITALGHPAKVIIDESNMGYDLLVMGSRGLGDIESFMLGSVTSRVSHHTKIPLLIVRG